MTAPSQRGSFRQEELVARAKRTDRTDARRRNRAAQGAPAEADTGDATTATTTSGTPSRRPRGSAATPVAPPPRPGIFASMRAANHPLDLRGDLRAAPQILTNPGFIIAVVATIAAGIFYVVTFNDTAAAIPVGTLTAAKSQEILGQAGIAAFIGTFVLQPPPILGAFLIGFLAKRGSWLAGLVYGVIALIVAAVVFQTQAARLVSWSQTGEALSPDALIVQAAAMSPIGGAILSSLAAWYRRFLDLANPNRGQRPAAKPPQGRGNMRQKTVR
jgi:hypothetical protein